MPEVQNQTRLRLRVTAAAEAALRAGHPWLFRNSIREQNRKGASGELAVVYDRKDRFLAVGLYDDESPICFRTLHTGKPQSIDQNWWAARLEDSILRRAGLLSQHTNGLRWIYGESDGWPGLVLDQYAGTLVLKVYTSAWLPRLSDVADLFYRRFLPQTLVLRLSRNVRAAAGHRGFSDGQVLRGDSLAGPVVFRENGIRFEADVIFGQKTGFFLDQRENRSFVQSLSRNRSVLNTFSFSGAFSVYAARGGARSVTDLDISAHALDAANRNFTLNQEILAVAQCQHDTVQADAFEWLACDQRKFDLVILDPPSLAKRESERAGAIRAYGKLAGLGLGHLSPGGILLACSCSAHVSTEEFFAVVRQAGQRHGRVEEVKAATHPLDHPAAFKEAQYLKAIYLRCH